MIAMKNHEISDTHSDNPARIDDAVLPLLVSQAAIEFDCAIRNVANTDFEAATRLGQMLKSFAGESNDVKVNADPVAVGLVALAVRESNVPDVSPTDYAEQTAQLGRLLASNTKTSAQWPVLRDFCVSFAEALVEYRQSLRAMQPENPNRR